MGVYLYPSGTETELKNAYIGEYDFAKYQEVEYIQSTATNPWADNSSWQCIDTLYTHNPNTKISVDIQFTTTAKQQRLFWIATSSSSYSTFAAYINWSTQWARATKDGEWNWQTTSVSADTNRHTFVLQNSNYVIYTNWATTYSGNNWNTMTKWGSHTLPLLCAWGDGDGKYFCHASAKLYGCKIWDSWTLVRDFIPCYRKSDTVIWLYDLVNNQFYTNSWTWTFTKWPDVN